MLDCLPTTHWATYLTIQGAMQHIEIMIQNTYPIWWIWIDLIYTQVYDHTASTWTIIGIIWGWDCSTNNGV